MVTSILRATGPVHSTGTSPRHIEEPGRDSDPAPVLIGRIREMEALDRALRTASHGKGQCFTIAADAGIGNSRILSELWRRAGVHGFVLVQGDCLEQDSAFPCAPWVDALRAHLGHRKPVEIRDHVASRPRDAAATQAARARRAERGRP